MSEYISREAAIDAIFGQFCASSDETEAALNSAVEDIKSIPAADVRPVRRGEWIDAPNPQWPAYDIRHCSCCGWSIPKTKLRAKDLNWSFCPNCGADMGETDDEEA